MTYDYQTSYPAYKEPGKDVSRQKVFSAIRKLELCTDKQIAEYLRWEINKVTPRRNELEAAGLIESAGKWTNGKRTVNWWRVKKVVIQGQMF